MNDADGDDEDVDNDNDNWISDWIHLNELPDDKELDNIMDFTVGDVLGKTLALVKQVSSFSFFLFPLPTINRFVLLLKQSSTLCCVASLKVSLFLS